MTPSTLGVSFGASGLTGVAAIVDSDADIGDLVPAAKDTLRFRVEGP